MRILKLEFENLNSLKGKWEIDFTNPAYAENHDIFVISGETGAGKTTLLDAITLALYGRTPRQEAVNTGKGGNEIMTRGTYFCRSRVTYKCKNGIYSSEFFQNRAKASGKLQNANFIIYDKNGTEIKKGSASNLSKETQQIIQLDYEQFCRSIMLAQGEFSTFLKSSSQARAEILEKLTGTERYRKVGAKIAEKFSDVKRDYKEKKEQKEAIEKSLMSEEDFLAEQEKLNKNQDELLQTEKKLETLQTELNFLSELSRLNAELFEAQNKKNKIELELKNFSQSEQKLVIAQATRKCEGAFASVKNCRAEQNDDLENLKNLDSKISDAKIDFEKAAAESKSAQEAFLKREKFQSEQQSVWKKVRELDTKISSAKKNALETQRNKEKLEQTFFENKERISALDSELSVLEKNCTELQNYLFAHQNDENLLRIITRSETLKSSADKSKIESEKFDSEKNSIQKEICNLESNIKLKQEELKNIEKEINEFISSDAVFISELLQNQLKKGKPCPVCGNIYCGEEVQQNVSDLQKAQNVFSTSKNFSELRKKSKEALQNLQTKFERAKSDFKNADDNFSVAQKNYQEVVKQIENEFLPWQEEFKNLEIEKKISKAKNLFDSWTEKKSALEKNSKTKSEKEAEQKTLLENLRGIEKMFEEAKTADSEAQNALQMLVQERNKLFGEKSVDAVEAEVAKEIEVLKAEAANSEKRKLDFEKKQSELNAKKEQVHQSFTQRISVLEESESNFKKMLNQNGFDSEDSFLNARMSEKEFSELSEKSENLKTQKTQAAAALENAQKSYENYKQNASAIRETPEVQNEISAVKSKKEILQKNAVDIKTKLNLNEQNKKSAQKIISEFEEVQKNFALWEEVSKISGKADGSEISVFVQSLAFNKLLERANKKLYGMTERFKIIQKEAGTLDFAISDTYFSEPRAISNLSGGEQFLVSLSLALGISEFASQNVKVDSLFLDEGFGTLSGKLLTEAVNTLKALQKNNKMLGIITHVHDVIAEIPQQIIVKKCSDGTSILLGSGITHD